MKLKLNETRRHVYAFTLLGSVLGIALISLLNIWGLGLSAALSYQIVMSLIVTAGLSGFLHTLTYNHEKKFIKKLGTLVGVMAVGLSAIILGHIWFNILEKIVFGKLAFTFAIIGFLAALVIAIADDFFESKKMKDENYLD